MGKYTQQEETDTKMPGYRGRNYQSSGNDALVARKEEERIRRYRENEARQEAEWACAISSERERDEERRPARGHWDLPMIDRSSERMTARGNRDLTMHNTGGARMTARGRWDLTMHNTRSGSQRQWTQ